MYSQQQQNGNFDMKKTFNLFYLLVHGYATTCTVFLRTDFGKEGIGIYGLAGFALIVLYGGLSNSYAMFIFLCAYLLATLSQRMKTFANWRKGIMPHSRYGGYPIVSKRLFPRMDELNLRGVDAFICLVTGGALTIFVDKALGIFLMGAGLSILISENITGELHKRRLQAMRDAEIEQRYLAETYKSDRF